MKSMQTKSLRFTGMIIAASLLLFSVPLLTQGDFDPRTELPPGCLKGDFNCGLIPESVSSIQSVPEDPANLIRHRGLPSQADVSSYMPPVGSQGAQGSCVAWATTYYVKSYQEHRERNWSYDADPGVYKRCNSSASKIFSPAWTYNQINRGRDRGSSIYNAFALIVRSGAATCNRMPYNSRDYRTQPNAAARSQAARFRGEKFNRVDCKRNPNALKAVLAKGHPVVAGFRVTRGLSRMGTGVWDTFDGNVRGGHAMVIVGYDDNKRSSRGARGAFKIVNSWGMRWGDRGYGWISYRNMPAVCKYAYVLYDRRGGGTKKEIPKPPIPTSEKTKLSPPARVNASRGLYSDRVVVSWSSVQGASAYSVERSAPGDGSFRNLGYAQGSTFTDRSVQADVAYKYRIVVRGDGRKSSDAESSPVAEGYAKKRNQLRRPDRVTGLKLRGLPVKGGTGIVLTWNKAARASYYQVLRYNSSTRTWKTLENRERRERWQDNRPLPNQVNYYAVRAKNPKGYGAWSSTAGLRVGGSITPPGKTFGLKASINVHRRKIQLEWTPVSGASNYEIFRYSYSDSRWSKTGTSRSTSYADDSSVVNSGAWFAYSIRAVNARGAGPFSDAQQGKANPNLTRAGAVLPPPENVRGKINERRARITLSWNRVKGASEYYIYRKEEKEKKYFFLNSVSGRKTKFVGDIPEKGDLYYYVIRSKSFLGGESANSRPIAAFLNNKIPVVRKRFIPGANRGQFLGTWKSTRLIAGRGGKIKRETLELRIRKFSQDRFRLELKRDGRRRVIYGNGAHGSRKIDGEGFTLELLKLNSNQCVVSIDNRRLHPDRIMETFIRVR